MEVSRKAYFRTIWNDKDITTDITKYLSSVRYVDHEEGMSDSVEFVFDNSDALFSNDWYADSGTTIQLFIGYEDEQVDCGLFQVDKIRFSGLPDICTIEGISAGITKKLRTKNNKAFENLNLKQIAKFFASKHDLELVDTSSMLSQINLPRKTQKDKTDLSFLSELAKEYGFIFSIRGEKLVFISYYDLDNVDPVVEIDKTEIGNYSLSEKTTDTYKSGSISIKNTKENKVVSFSKTDTDLDGNGEDELVIQGSATNDQQAEAKVKASLWNKNKSKKVGSLSNFNGNPQLVSGVNFTLTGFGLASGIYHIVKSSHTVQGGGAYTTSIEIRKTGTVEAIKMIPKA